MPQIRPPWAAAYDAVIDSIYARGRPETVLIADSSVVFRAVRLEGTVPRWRAQYDSFPAELVADLVRLSSTKVPTSQLPLPSSARTIAAADLREIFRNGPDGWGEFYRRYPRQRLWIALSPIAFDRDSSQAVLYREYHCGSLCGGGDLLWLERRPDATWYVRKHLNFWIS